MTAAFEELFGIPNAFGRIPMPGRTDLWLLSHALESHGIAWNDPRERFFHDAYVRLLAVELDRPPPPDKYKGVLPGVREVLEAAAARSDVCLALLTGNYEAGARLKLEHFDLWRFFRCGAFGDSHSDRNELLSTVTSLVKTLDGAEVDAARTMVIGDTPHDVAVAKAGGARSMAVATGSHDVEALRATGADYVFENLSDVPAVLRVLLQPPA
jgi:phosphoglycolate phosphatase